MSETELGIVHWPRWKKITIFSLLAVPVVVAVAFSADWFSSVFGGSLDKWALAHFVVMGIALVLVTSRTELRGESYNAQPLAPMEEFSSGLIPCPTCRSEIGTQADEAQRQKLLERHQNKEALRNQPRDETSAVHAIDREGEISVDWQKQLEEISRAWRKGDYDFARDWLQKLAYRLSSENAPEAVHTKFKALMAEFTRDDPLYAEVMRVALPVIADQPGIVQSQLAKQFPQFAAEHFRYAMYYGEIIGDVIREKKGRSYALTRPTTAQKENKPSESLKQMGTEAIQARRHNHGMKRRAQMLEVKHLRPFWQLIGTCAGNGAERKTLLVSDPFWDGSNVPWNCNSGDCNCDCRVHSLSRIEMVRYVESGCSPGDEAAADQLRIWEEEK